MRRNLILVLSIITTIVLMGLFYYFYKVKPSSPRAEGETATLALAPNSGSFQLGQNFSVNIMANSSGRLVSAIDIDKLHFDPQVLEVTDSDSNTDGTQISPGSLFANVMVNSVDNQLGEISFSAFVGPGNPGVEVNGALATINFKTKAASGGTPLTFDFQLGSTGDSNIVDDSNPPLEILGSVTNASFVVNGNAEVPTVNLKVNDGDGPLTINSGDSANLSWLATNAVSCTASGDWTGSKDTSGTESTGALNANKTYTITCAGNQPDLTTTDTVEVKVNTPPPTVSLKGNDIDDSVKIPAGGKLVLTWTSTNATSCTASGDWSGEKPVSGTEEINSLTEAKTYILTCVKDQSEGSDTIVVSIAQPAPKVDLKVNNENGPITVNSGTSVTLSWTSSNATGCEASGHWSGAKEAAGEEKTGNLGTSKQYILTCANADGVTASDEVIIRIDTPDPASPTVDLKINDGNGPLTLNSGQTAKLSWASAHAASCTASGDWSGAKATSGNETTASLTANKTYTITCKNNNLESTDTVLVKMATTSTNVTPAPETNSVSNFSVVSNSSSAGDAGTSSDTDSGSSDQAQTSAPDNTINDTPQTPPIAKLPDAVKPQTKPVVKESPSLYKNTGMKSWTLWIFYAIIPIFLTGTAVYFFLRQSKKNKKVEII